MALEAARVVFEARECAAELIGAPDSSRVVFTKNATEAINLAIKGLGIGASSRVVSTTFEHNSLAKAVRALGAGGVDVLLLEPDEDGVVAPSRIEESIKEGAALVAMSHASNVFGAIQDVAAIGRICKEHGVLFMVDAAQTTGALPVNVVEMNIDILATTGHKALFGPQGTGLLYLREGLEITPLLEGGTGDEASVLEMPERLEAGTLNTPGIGGLGAGIEFVLSTGIERIREHEVSLMEELLRGLRAIEGVSIIGPKKASHRVSLAAFNVEGRYPVPIGLGLDRGHDIMTRCGTHCSPQAHRAAGTFPEGAVRVSPGFFTTHDEIKAFLRALEEVIREPC